MAEKLIVDKEKCMGCGTCIALAGKSFKLGDDGKSIALNPPGDEENAIQSAIDGCPVKAISRKEK